MKKKFLVVLCLTTAVLMAGCGAKEDKKDADTAPAKTESTEAASGAAVSTQDEDRSKYVTLGNYKGLELNKLTVNVTDEDVENEIQSNLQAGAEKEQIKTGKVKDGDTVNIDYEGKKDGTAFDGGTAKDYNLEIGSGSFIEGFEEGLVDTEVGKTVELNLTFPEDYPSEDLAGQDVVFTVTVNYICGKDIIPELTPEWIAENSSEGSKTEEDYRTEIKNQLETDAEENNALETENQILSILVNNSKVSEYPEDKVEEYKNQVNGRMESSASMYGMETKDFIQNYYGMTEDQYQEKLDEIAKDATAQEMIVSMIAEKEGLGYTNEQLKEKKEEVAKEYSYQTAEEFEEAYGKEEVEAELTKELLYDVVMDYIKNNAVFTEQADTEAASGASLEAGTNTEAAAEENEEAAE